MNEVMILCTVASVTISIMVGIVSIHRRKKKENCV